MNNVKLSIASTDYDHFPDFRTGSARSSGRIRQRPSARSRNGSAQSSRLTSDIRTVMCLAPGDFPSCAVNLKKSTIIDCKFGA